MYEPLEFVFDVCETLLLWEQVCVCVCDLSGALEYRHFMSKGLKTREGF